MSQTDQEIVEAHQQRLARRRAKYMADAEYFRARQRAWAHSPSGKASLARKRAKDAARAKAQRAAYQAALQATAAVAAPTLAPATKSRTFVVTITEQL